MIYSYSQLFWSLPKFEELSGQEQEVHRSDKEAYDKLFRHGWTRLYLSRLSTEGETWVPLIEKAYAKLHGDRQSLEGGFPSEAIEDQISSSVPHLIIFRGVSICTVSMYAIFCLSGLFDISMLCRIFVTGTGSGKRNIRLE